MEPVRTNVFRRVLLVLGLTSVWAATAAAGALDDFHLPDAWETVFWASPNARRLLTLDPRAVADLVPIQAGIRYCRCPNCDADESDDPLEWSVEAPQSLRCRRCRVTVPNDKFPARDEKKHVPEDAVEVLPGRTHKYPYHEVEPGAQRYPGERLYLAAKADDRAREFLARAALYAAVRYREQAAGHKDVKLSVLSATILVRFSQVYATYATHYDQPNSLKFFQNADLRPPYRGGYRTGKWESSGNRNVPLNLVLAYAILRGDPALAGAGRLLGVADPVGAVEQNLFRASAEFVRDQPDESNEASLPAYKGMLAVGRLLGDEALTRDALARVARFSRVGFYHDGFWKQGTLASHRRVLGELDGWIEPMAAVQGPGASGSATGDLSMIALARSAGSAVLSSAPAAEVLQVGWPSRDSRPALHSSRLPRSPRFLGGAGIARLAAGEGDDALDVEVRGLPSFGPSTQQRQTLRVSVGGQALLGDLDETPGLPSGFDRASASHNTVLVDGLNQRESLGLAREPAPGSDFLFFSADPDFQVVTLDDPHAYPESTTRYRQTLVVSAVGRSRYSLSVFEVRGGLQHDQFFHAASGTGAQWRLSMPAAAWPGTLLAPGLTFLPSARADDGRWFIQAYGEFAPRTRASVEAAGTVFLKGPAAGGLRLHLLGDTPVTAITATSPDPASPAKAPGDDSGRLSLIVRRRAPDGSTLASLFVTLFEPVSGTIPPLARVGRVASPPGTVVLLVETSEGPEHLVINLAPGTVRRVTLADGRSLSTDGLAVRLVGPALVLAGGTFADVPGLSVRQRSAAGRIVGSVRKVTEDGHGWFESDTPLADPASLAGRTLLIRHRDGTTHGWTLNRVENTRDGARLHVREEPGFRVDRTTGEALYYQFPLSASPGPHSFRISRVAR